jgi:hypothetical protein
VVHTPAYASGGAHTLTLRASDPAGNQTSKSLDIHLDLTPPAAAAQLQGDASKTAGEATANSGVLTFHTEAGATVLVNYLRAGGGQVQKIYVATGQNQASVLTSANLATLGDGLIQASVSAIDLAGNLAPAIPVEFTLDTVVAPPMLRLAQDTGTAGDGISEDGTIQITGLEAGATWQYSLDAGANWLPGAGASLTLLSGTYAAGQVRARQTDAAGNLSSEGSLGAVEILAAPEAPTTLASITQALDDQPLVTGVIAHNGASNDASLQLAGALSAPLIAGESVRIYDGAAWLGDAAVEGQSWSFQTSGLVEGDHVFSARVANAADLTGPAGDAYNVQVDTQAPSLSAFVLTAESDSGLSGDNRGNDVTPSIQFTAEAGAVLEIDLGIGLGFVATGVLGTGALQTLTAPAGLYISDGDYTVQLRATDAVGNRTTRSAQFTLDTTLATPTLALINDTGTSDNDHISSNAGLTFSAPAADVTRLISLDGGAASPTYAAPGNDGLHTVQVTDTDTAGNTATASLTFTLDTQAPITPGLTLASDTGLAGDGISSDGLVNVGNLEAGTTWEYSLDAGANWLPGSDAGFALGNGVYPAGQVKARQTDAAGNVSGAGSLGAVEISAAAPAALASIVQIIDDAEPVTGALADDARSNDVNLLFHGQLTASLAVGESVRIHDGATLLGEAATTGPFTWSFTTPNLADGPHSFTATVFSAAGISSAPSSARTIIIDTQSPTLTPFTLHPDSDTGAPGDHLSNDATPSIQFTAEAGVTLAISVGGSFSGLVIGTGVAQTATVPAGVFTADGPYTVQLRATDVAGNSTTQSTQIGRAHV